jgi:hypothetical protein
MLLHCVCALCLCRLRELPTPSVQYSMPIGDESQVHCCYTLCYITGTPL